MVLEQHCALYFLLLNMKRKRLILHAFEKLREIAHICDVIEVWGVINVVKLPDVCNYHIQFDALLGYLYDMMIFFKFGRKWGQKLDLIKYGSLRKILVIDLAKTADRF